MDIVSLPSYLAVSFFMLSAGLFTVASRRNIIGIFMGIELILNAAALNFAALSRLAAGTLDGQVVSLFVILLAAAEAAIAMALMLAVYKRYRDINADNLTNLKL